MMQLASASRERLMCAPSSRRARSPARSEPARSMRNSRPRCTPFDTDLLTDTLYTKVTGQFNMLTSACVMGVDQLETNVTSAAHVPAKTAGWRAWAPQCARGRLSRAARPRARRHWRAPDKNSTCSFTNTNGKVFLMFILYVLLCSSWVCFVVECSSNERMDVKLMIVLMTKYFPLLR